MDCRTLLPEQLPHTTKLIRDYVDHFPKLETFYSHPPDLKSIIAEAKQLQFPVERRHQVADILSAQNKQFGSSSVTLENIDRLYHGAVPLFRANRLGCSVARPMHFTKRFPRSTPPANSLKMASKLSRYSGWLPKITILTRFATPLGFTKANCTVSSLRSLTKQMSP